MPRVNTTTAALITTVLATLLLVYVFGATSTLWALLWAGAGALIGWLGSLALRTDTQGGILFDIGIGSVGAICGVLLFGGGLAGGSVVERVLSAILGAVIFVAIGGFIRRANARQSAGAVDVADKRTGPEPSP